MTPTDRLYTKEHEWVLVKGDVATVGITEYAQRELGEIVYVELPEVRQTFSEGDACGTIESVKAVAEIYVPVSGEILERNEAVQEDPEVVNNDPYGEGWLLRMRFSDSSSLKNLMSAEKYEDFLKEGE
ncbi:MAG TPA: glycine cleavage system protein GcvH [Ktedonobacteraceae bacterium]|nr:glycine cleavage system protein GcvH [Ktedonobacteraceae bacterium]